MRNISNVFVKQGEGDTNREPPAPDGEPPDVPNTLAHWQPQHHVTSVEGSEDGRVPAKEPQRTVRFCEQT
jgi:hypothetical protein